MTDEGINRRFGARLHNLRMERRLSQEALGAKTDMPQHYLSQLEKGKISPTLTTIEKLARGLDVQISDLLDFPEKRGGKQDRVREEIELANRVLRRLDLESLRRLRRAIEAFAS